MADNAIGILFQVKGEGSLSGESGRLIKSQFDQIVKELEAQLPKIKFTLDIKDLKAQLDSLTQNIQKQFSSITVSPKIKTSSGGQDNPAQMSKQYELLTNRLKEYRSAKELLNSISDTSAESFRVQSQEVDKLSASLDRLLMHAQNRNGTSAVDGVDAATLRSLQQEKAEIDDLRNKKVELRRLDVDQKRAAKEASDAARAALAAEKQATRELAAEQRALQQADNARLGVTKATDNAQAILRRNQDLINSNKDAAAAALQLQTLIDRAPGGNASVEDLRNYQRELVTLTARTNTAFSQIDIQTNTLGRRIKETFSSKVIQTFSYALIALAVGSLKKVYDNVLNVDTAMTELRIVTKSTSDEYVKFADRVAESAQKIGASVSDLIKSTTTFARLGFSLEEASTLAEITTAYSKVGDVSVDDATKNITGIVKAYGVSASELESVVDRLIYVGRRFAISSGEIGAGMNNAASSLAANGNSLNEAMGILTAANTTVQDISRASTATRTIAARLSASKQELEELGETVTADTVIKLEQAFKAYGIAITDNNGELKSTYDILDSIAARWDDLNKEERSAITTLAAGTRQQDIFYSLVQNWNDAKRVVAEADTSTGELADATAERLDSIQGKIDQLKAQWESISQDLLSGEFLKEVLTILGDLLSVLNQVTSVGNGMVVKAAAAAGAVALLGKALMSFGLVAKTTWANIAPVATIVLSALAMLTANADAASKKLIGIFTTVAGAFITLVSVIKTQTAGLSLALASNPIGLIILGVSTLVGGLLTLGNTLRNTVSELDNLTDASNKSASAARDATEDLNNLDAKLKETKARLKELQTQAQNGKLNIVEESELKRLQQTTKQLEAERTLLEATQKAAQAKAAADAFSVYSFLERPQSDTEYNASTGFFLQDILGFRRAPDGNIIWDPFDTQEFNFKTRQQQLDDYLSDIAQGKSTTSTDEYVRNYIKRLQQLSANAGGYYAGEELEQWQQDANTLYMEYITLLSKYNVATGNVQTAWDAALSLEKFENARKFLLSLDGAVVTSEQDLKWLALTSSYGTENLQEFLDYLKEVGLYIPGDKKSLDALIQSFRELAVEEKRLEKKTFVSVLEEYQDGFDALSKALASVEENGVASADAIQEILTKYPSLIQYFKQTDQGFVFADPSLSSYQVLQKYVTTMLQPYVDTLNKAVEGTENYSIAQENLNNAIAAFATLLRSTAISEQTKVLNDQKDALEKQRDSYKELIDYRKKLLQTYKEEVDYKKELEEKQKSVADLQTQLAIAQLDTSAAGQARARAIQDELTKAQEDLSDFTLEHAIDVITEQLDEEEDAQEKFIKSEVDRLEEAIKNIKLNIKVEVNIPDPTPVQEEPTSKPKSTGGSTRGGKRILNVYEDLYPIYHTGGWVGGEALASNEEFAKLMKGEFVVTPSQIRKFANETFPNLVNNSSTSQVNYNAPLVTIHCESVTQETMPAVQKAVDKAVAEIKKDFDSAFGRVGLRKKTTKLSTNMNIN